MATLSNGPPVHRHLATAKEHLAGVAAGRKWVQELAAAHLLRAEYPAIERPPVKEEGGGR